MIVIILFYMYIMFNIIFKHSLFFAKIYDFLNLQFLNLQFSI